MRAFVQPAIDGLLAQLRTGLEALRKEVDADQALKLSKALAGLTDDSRMKALEQRLAEFEAREVVHGKDGRNAFDVAVSVGYEGDVYAWLESLVGAPGKDATPEHARTAVAAYLAEHPITQAKNGTSVTIEDVKPLFEAAFASWALDFERRATDLLHRSLERIEKPQNGKDASPEAIRAAVDAFMAAHPLPKLGADVVVESAQIEAAVAAHLKAHPPASGGPGRAPTAEEISTAAATWLRENPPEAGRPPTADEIRAALAAHLAAHPIREPLDGKDATPEQVRAAIAAHLEAHPIPAPINGKDATEEQVAAGVAAHLEAHPIREPLDGKDATPEQVRAALAAHLEAHPIPVPADGHSVTVEDVVPWLERASATWALEFERRAQDTMQRAVDRLERPRDGKDGLSVANFSAELGEDGRTITLSLADGERQHVTTLVMPWPLDRGVFVDGMKYVKGDGVTFGGSWWIAQKSEPKGRPGTSADWRLAVKHGRDTKRPT
ncbi:MAG: hypothetical protein ABI640_12975 [Gammaproteobacteria bacterium]